MIEQAPLPIWKQIITMFTIVVFCPPETVFELMWNESDTDD